MAVMCSQRSAQGDVIFQCSDLRAPEHLAIIRANADQCGILLEQVASVICHEKAVGDGLSIAGTVSPDLVSVTAAQSNQGVAGVRTDIDDAICHGLAPGASGQRMCPEEPAIGNMKRLDWRRG